MGMIQPWAADITAEEVENALKCPGKSQGYDSSPHHHFRKPESSFLMSISFDNQHFSYCPSNNHLMTCVWRNEGWKLAIAVNLESKDFIQTTNGRDFQKLKPDWNWITESAISFKIRMCIYIDVLWHTPGCIIIQIWLSFGPAVARHNFWYGAEQSQFW